MPRSERSDLLLPKNAGRCEDEIRNEQLSYKQDGYEFLHACEVA
jgi:hypothetical protein